MESMTDALPAAFSPNPVKVGDTWHSSVDENGSKIEADLTLDRVSTERGKQVAHLHVSTASAPVGGSWIAVDVDIATGILLRLEMMSKGGKDAGKGPAMHVLIRLR